MPGRSPELPARVLEHFAAVDCIVALGDMGESSGLDRLETVAPVIGVRGMDDVKDDPRTAAVARILSRGNLRIGALFDGTSHGLLSSNDPFEPVEDFAGSVRCAFGRRLDVLLCAASHKSCIAWAEGTLIVNPGSPTLAERRTVAIVRVGARHVAAEVASV